MTTIAVRKSDKCQHCGDGLTLDHVATGQQATKWRRAVNVSQETLATKGMGIKQSFYSALEKGQRHWTPALIQKFEQSIKPLMKERNINAASL